MFEKSLRIFSFFKLQNSMYKPIYQNVNDVNFIVNMCKTCLNFTLMSKIVDSWIQTLMCSDTEIFSRDIALSVRPKPFRQSF